MSADLAPDASSAPALEVIGLQTRFGTHVVHDNLNLSVRRGEVLGLVGASGSGKSVLFNTILGLLNPTAGDVRLLGERAGADSD